MNKLKRTSQFKKDIRRIKSQNKNFTLLKDAILDLEKTGYVKTNLKPHKLRGIFSKYFECHLEPDWLLIWQHEANNTIKLIRTGSYSELFGK